jgi:pimeloyl-ACP methyl ester carboxylesterase
MPIAGSIYYFSHNENERSHPPIILIHGAGGNHLYWPPEIRRLPDQRVYAVDLPGHGKSEGVGRQSISAYARNLIAFMDASNLPKAIIVGHSMGSAIALTLGLDHARRVLGAVLIGSSARLKVAQQILESSASPATFPVAVQLVNDWSFGPHANPRIKELAIQRMAETRPAVLHGDYNACDKFDLTERIHKLRAPTLILCGTEDKMTPLKQSEELAEKIKNSSLITIPGAGHMVMLEQPGVVAQAIVDFATGIKYRSGE